MTKTFEEELFNKVPCKFELTTEAEYKKSTLINHFKNWHSDEEFQEMKESYWNQAESILSMLDEIKSLKSQLQQQALPKTVEDFQGELEDLIDDILDDDISDSAFDGKKYKFIEKYAPQALPVVPECAAGAIESIPDHYSAFGAIDLIIGKIETLPVENEDWLPVYNWLYEDTKNQDTFALAFMTRKYEVEKPQLFYIELPNVYGLKNKIFVSKVENGTIVEFSNGKNYALKFTEQEIKSIDERYWQFAVPVEDGEWQKKLLL